MTTLASLYVPNRARRELAWFFREAAAEMGFRSNFEMIQSATRLTAHHDPGDAELARADLEGVSGGRRFAMERWREDQEIDHLRHESRQRLRTVWNAMAELLAAHRRAIEATYADRFSWPNMVGARFGERVGLLAVSTVAREAFVDQVVSKRGSDALGPVPTGAVTQTGIPVSPNGRRVVVRQVAILDWLDDLCRHSVKGSKTLLSSIDAECKSLWIASHREYATVRGLLKPEGVAA
jgi:hypothetical protein